MLAPVNGPRIHPIAVIAKPNFNGIESWTWELRGSHTPQQIKIRTVVAKYSIANACNGVKSPCGAVTQIAGPAPSSALNVLAGVITSNNPYPMNAPNIWAMK